MRVLVACEFSGTVRRAFRDRGHDAWSCDLLPAADGSPYHYQQDVIPLLDDGWDLMIAHPPCTYLSVSGMHWTVRGLRDPQLTEDALEFVRQLMRAPIKKKAIENPVSIISTRIRKPDQIIHPNQFGHDASKKTCLWLEKLPHLVGTKDIAPRWYCCGRELPEGVGKRGCPNCNGEKVARPRWGNQTPSGQNKLGPSDDRWAVRSETYSGIAEAMADQWGGGTVSEVPSPPSEGTSRPCDEVVVG